MIEEAKENRTANSLQHDPIPRKMDMFYLFCLRSWNLSFTAFVFVRPVLLQRRQNICHYNITNEWGCRENFRCKINDKRGRTNP